MWFWFQTNDVTLSIIFLSLLFLFSCLHDITKFTKHMSIWKKMNDVIREIRLENKTRNLIFFEIKKNMLKKMIVREKKSFLCKYLTWRECENDTKRMLFLIWFDLISYIKYNDLVMVCLLQRFLFTLKLKLNVYSIRKWT